MSDHSIRRIIRESGVLEAMSPPEAIRQQHVVSQVIEPTGGLVPDAVRPFLTPKTYRFFLPGTTATGQTAGADRIVRAGHIVRIDALAQTPPTSRCVVEIRTASATTLGTVTINPNESSGESAGLSVPVNAGTWIVALVMEHGNAANLSIVVTQQLR